MTHYYSIEQEKSELVELAGCSSWDDILEWFGNMTQKEILTEAQNTWPHEENLPDFADRIYNAISVTRYQTSVSR